MAVNYFDVHVLVSENSRQDAALQHGNPLSLQVMMLPSESEEPQCTKPQFRLLKPHTKTSCHVHGKKDMGALFIGFEVPSPFHRFRSRAGSSCG